MHRTGRDHGLRHRLHQAGFNALYRRSLIYNQCWEDPRVDRQALDLGPDSEIMVITSGGCNTLDYLLCEPRLIHAVDANPLQTALLELKIAGIKQLEWADFFKVFGEGRHPHYKQLYKDHLRQELSKPSQDYWDKNKQWWKGGRVRRSFYDHGLSGIFARMFVGWVATRPKLKKALVDVFLAENMDDQRAIWQERVVPELFTPAAEWLFDRQALMNLLGVPYEQQRNLEGNVSAYARQCLDGVVMNLPLHENYFYRVYLENGFKPDACPEYLKEENFERLKQLIGRVKPVTSTITDYLQTGAARPSHLVLLDHMDWMGTAFPEALVEEWCAILDNAVPGARVLFRSGEINPLFLDAIEVRGVPLRETLTWQLERAENLHKLDRVGTYASFWIGNLNNAPAETANEE